MSLTKDKIRLLTFTLDLQTAIAQKTQQNLIFRYEAIEHGTPEPPIWTSPGKFFARVIKAITWLKLEWWVVYEWTNFVLLIVITSQSNPLNWCWYSNSRKKNWKDNGVGYGVVKIFLRSRLAVVKVLIFPQPGRETRLIVEIFTDRLQSRLFLTPFAENSR